MTEREPTIDDVEQLTALIDAQESAIDVNHKPASPSWALGLVRGHNDSPRNRIWLDQGHIVAWASMQPDQHRHRIEVEIFRVPGYSSPRRIWNWVLDTQATDFSGWVLWPTINSHDHEMEAIFTETGFSLLRRFHFLTRPLANDHYPELTAGATIKVITTDGDFAEWHAAHQDSFSQHFGFTPDRQNSGSRISRNRSAPILTGDFCSEWTVSWWASSVVPTTTHTTTVVL